MRAAIYARKSTDDDHKTPDNKSVHRQVQHARDYAEARGWTVDPEHIFIDDGISGAEYKNRPGLLRLLDHTKDFDALVMSESSRLGRDMTRNSYHLTTIIDAGVQVWYYLTDEQERADTPEARLMLTLKSYASEVEREKASQRSRDALQRRAKKGYNTGGRVYGYDNVPVYATNSDGEKVKSHTDFSINEEEADAVRRIFTMYADGHGHTIIAKTMNADPKYSHFSLRYFDGKTPNTPRKGTGSWCPSSVYAILRNERYIGLIPWGRHRKAWRGGTKLRERQDQYMKTERKDLRIVPQDLWDRVHRRMKAVRANYIRDTNGNLWGRPDKGRASRFLLSGLVKCGTCGANMIATYIRTGSKDNRRKDRRYHCSWHGNRGSTVCDNKMMPRMKEVDGMVLDAIRDTVLNPEALRYVIHKAVEEVARLQKENPDRSDKLKKELRKTEGELQNLVAAVAGGRGPKSIMEEITVRERKAEALRTELLRHTTKTTGVNYRKLEQEFKERLERFQELIYGDVPVARQALRKLLKEPLILIPKDGKTYEITGETRLGALFSPAKVNMASPRGFEPRSPP